MDCFSRVLSLHLLVLRFTFSTWIFRLMDKKFRMVLVVSLLRSSRIFSSYVAIIDFLIKTVALSRWRLKVINWWISFSSGIYTIRGDKTAPIHPCRLSPVVPSRFRDSRSKFPLMVTSSKLCFRINQSTHSFFFSTGFRTLHYPNPFLTLFFSHSFAFGEAGLPLYSLGSLRVSFGLRFSYLSNTAFGVIWTLLPPGSSGHSRQFIAANL